MARAFYQKLSERFRNYYYAELGRARLKNLGRQRQRGRHGALRLTRSGSGAFDEREDCGQRPSGR